MTCRELVDFLMAYDDGELPPEQRRAFEDHLCDCTPCVAYLETYRKAIALGRAACGCPDKPILAEVPESLVKAIMAAKRAARG